MSCGFSRLGPAVRQRKRGESNSLVRSSTLHPDVFKRNGVSLQLLLGHVGQAGGVRGGALHGAQARVGARGRQLAGQRRAGRTVGSQRSVVVQERLGRWCCAVRLGVGKVVGGREVERGRLGRRRLGGEGGGGSSPRLRDGDAW